MARNDPSARTREGAEASRPMPRVLRQRGFSFDPMLLSQCRPQHGFEYFRLSQESEIVGVRAIRRALRIVAQQVVTTNVIQPRHPLFLELVEAFAQRRVIVRVMLIEVGADPRIGLAPIFDENDRSSGRAARSWATRGGHFSRTWSGPMLGRQSITKTAASIVTRKSPTAASIRPLPEIQG